MTLDRTNGTWRSLLHGNVQKVILLLTNMQTLKMKKLRCISGLHHIATCSMQGRLTGPNIVLFEGETGSASMVAFTIIYIFLLYVSKPIRFKGSKVQYRRNAMPILYKLSDLNEKEDLNMIEFSNSK